jgi:ribosomal protein L20A (L18A)
MELSGRHRVRRKDIAIIRVSVLKNKSECKRKNTV